MRITFITPPSLDQFKPAERTAGCTRVVYNMINIYELTVAALLEREGLEVRYRNFVLDEATPEDCFAFIREDDSDVYIFWTVNLSIPTDQKVAAYIHEWHPKAWVLFLGPGGTYFAPKLSLDARSVVVRGEPEVTTLELIRQWRDGKPWHETRGISYRERWSIIRLAR